MSRPKLVGLALLLVSPLLAGCDFNVGTRVCWSPSGRTVAFLVNGRPWAYDMASGSATKVIAPIDTADQIAWSSEEGLLAISTRNVVELISADHGRYAASAVFTAPEVAGADGFVLSWHPNERRLLLVQAAGERVQTSEIVASTETIDTAPGVGAYGPDGRWILWINQAAVGHQQDRNLAAREGLDHRVLPLSDDDQSVLGDNGADPMWFSGNPLCVKQRHDEQAKILCFDSSGRLRPRAALAKDALESGGGFVNREETLFAVLGGTPTIYDAKGAKKARGLRFAQAVEREIGDGSSETSNAAWSPDGNWIAVVVHDRLCLWNWRNDVVRILPALE